MSSIVQNIKAYLDYKGVSIAEMERECGLANATFSKAYAKKASIKSETIEKFLSVYNEISSDYLLRGIGAYEADESKSEIVKFLDRRLKEKDEIIKQLNIEIGKLYERLGYKDSGSKKAI